MKTWIIGDIHGKINIVNKILDSKEPNQIVFVGDFLDSFDLNIQDQINIIDRVLHELKNNSNIHAILGNHELSYIDNKKYGCSGHMYKTQVYMNTRINDILNYFDRSLVIDGFLITHAGVSKGWLPEDAGDTAEEIDKYIFQAPMEKLVTVGRARGGYFSEGGPFWCDFWKEFNPIPNVKQIFGHTAYRTFPEFGIVHMEESYNIDCLDHKQEILQLVDGKVSFIEL